MRTETRGETPSIRFTFVANVTAGIKYDREAKVWVGYAPALKVYSQAKTRARARKAIASAVNLFLRVAYKKGVLERVLTEAGFTPVEPGTAAPAARERIKIIEQKILKQEKFKDVFRVPAKLSLGRAA